MRYRALVAQELRSFKQIQRDFKRFQKRSKQIDKMMARANRPRDKIGRVIKKNVWGDEIVRVKNKWMLRSEVDGS
mgnify:CR=1 FL=1|jgi:hypothetical protein|tara:strand:- start:292 stop:516 length:225 start_codon:yes stop_codon:yes gene_type:complete